MCVCMRESKRESEIREITPFALPSQPFQETNFAFSPQENQEKTVHP